MHPDQCLCRAKTPSASNASTWKTCEPAERTSEPTCNTNGALNRVVTIMPSKFRVSLAMEAELVTMAETFTVPEIVVQFIGSVIVTIGAGVRMESVPDC